MTESSIHTGETVLIIQFARAPRVGQVKTRMLPDLSAEQACALHSELVLWTCGQLLSANLGEVRLLVTADIDSELFARCRRLGVVAVELQSGADLGERMYRALVAGLRDFSRVILVGSDCPALDKNYLQLAIDSLERAPVVLGPATDGGYVLVAVREVHEQMFTGISWGTSSVLSATEERLQALGLTWESLPPLADIDRPEDLGLWASIRTHGQ